MSDDHRIKATGGGRVYEEFTMDQDGYIEIEEQDVVRSPTGGDFECTCEEEFHDRRKAKEHLETMQWVENNLDPEEDPFEPGDEIIADDVHVEVTTIDGEHIMFDHSQAGDNQRVERDFFRDMVSNTDCEITPERTIA